MGQGVNIQNRVVLNVNFFKRFQLNTIKKKLYVIYVGLLFVPIILVGYYISVEIRSEQINTKIEEIEQSTIRTKQDLMSTFELLIRISDWIYQDERLAEIVEREYDSVYEVIQSYETYTQFSDYLKYYPEIDYVRFYSDNPTLLSSVGLYPVTSEITQQEWYQDTLDKRGQIVWRIIEDPITRQHNLNLTRSVFRNNRLIGVLSIAVANETIDTILASSGNSAFLTLDDHLIFSATQPEATEEVYDYYRLMELEKDNLELINENADSVQGSSSQLTFMVQQIPLNKSLISDFKIVSTVPTQSITEEANRVLVTGYLLIGLVFLLSLFILNRFIDHFNRRVLVLKESMTKVARGDFEIPEEVQGNDEISDIYHELQTTMGSLQNLLQERYQHELDQKNWEIVKKEAEFKLLASQINPHFLYNTLETIRMKALKNQDREVAETVKILSKLMRKALERDRDEILLSEDLKFIEMYLQIQQLRFGDRIAYTIRQNTQADYWILPLLIQPIVENAFIHGIEKVRGEVEVWIEVFEKESDLEIIIRDNGAGIEANRLATLRQMLAEGEGANRIGVNNVQQRIKHYYGEVYGLSIESVLGEGTQVTLHLPQKIYEEGDIQNAYGINR